MANLRTFPTGQSAIQLASWELWHAVHSAASNPSHSLAFLLPLPAIKAVNHPRLRSQVKSVSCACRGDKLTWWAFGICDNAERWDLPGIDLRLATATHQPVTTRKVVLGHGQTAFKILHGELPVLEPYCLPRSDDKLSEYESKTRSVLYPYSHRSVMEDGRKINWGHCRPASRMPLRYVRYALDRPLFRVVRLSTIYAYLWMFYPALGLAFYEYSRYTTRHHRLSPVRIFERAIRSIFGKRLLEQNPYVGILRCRYHCHAYGSNRPNVAYSHSRPYSSEIPSIFGRADAAVEWLREHGSSSAYAGDRKR